MPYTTSKRPITRRGSTSAPDPFNIHAQVNLDPNRSSTSTLTIVKVTDEPSSGHRKSVQRKFSPSPAADSPNRLSFAFSSFSSHNQTGRPSSPTQPTTPGSPTSSPRLRPSPHFPIGKPRFTPDQIVDLARQAANPIHTSDSHVFTALPDDVYLPFLDRPSEVAALITSLPDIKLFALLAQTFSLRDSQGQSQVQSDHLPRDPTTWTYHHLIHHLTKIDRQVAPDFVWSIAARKCILSHSELIWERVKGALGIPPELDVDYDFLEDDQVSPDGSEDGDEKGERHDNWEEAILDSPLISTGLPLLRTSPAADHDEHGKRKIPIPRDFACSELNPSNSDHDFGQIQVSIEPLVPSDVNLRPLSLPAGSLGDGLGLGDIAEGAEEEEEEAEEKGIQTDEGKVPGRSADPFNSILPSRIQGLRISTTPLSVVATPPLTAASTIAPSSPDPHLPLASAPPAVHSRSSSISSLVGPFNRSESTGALASLWSASAQAGVFSGSDAGDSYDDKEDDKEKMQGMGPMFPGNFARLGSALRRSSSSSTSTRRKLPHARYIASAVELGSTPPPLTVEGGGDQTNSPKEKVRAFSHAGGQRPFIPHAPRRRSWGALSGGA